MQKLKNFYKYAKISDTPFNQRSLIHREAWCPGGPRIPQNPNCLKNRKKSFKMQKLKNVQKYAKISDMPFDQRSLIHREAWFPPCFARQNQPFFFFLRFKTTFKQKCSNLRPLISITFPQGFRISKNIGHPIAFKRYLKSEHTDRRTDEHADGHFDLYRKHRPRGPMV